MLDLETLGNKPGSVIVAIGAVKFTAAEIVDEFSIVIDPRSCEQWGLKLDADTVMWWLQKSEPARQKVCGRGCVLLEALSQFRHWLVDPEAAVWGNGSEYDNVLLAAAYAAVQTSAPWKYYNNRCYRTLKQLCPQVPFQKPEVAHDALEDARAQALHLMQILPRLNIAI